MLQSLGRRRVRRDKCICRGEKWPRAGLEMELEASAGLPKNPKNLQLALPRMPISIWYELCLPPNLILIQCWKKSLAIPPQGLVDSSCSPCDGRSWELIRDFHQLLEWGRVQEGSLEDLAGKGRQLTLHLPSHIPGSPLPLALFKVPGKPALRVTLGKGLGNGCCLCWFWRSSLCFIFCSVGRGGIG
jgi:hypothetical protein